MVESVEIHGVPETDISRSLRDRLQALVGKRLDHDEADELNDLLEDERPGFSVERRISRGSERGRIRVVFEFSEEEGTAVDSVHAVAVEVRLPLRSGLERRARHPDGRPRPLA